MLIRNFFKQAIIVIFLMQISATAYSADTYILTSPPRENLEVGKQQYDSIAEYLTKTTGKTFTYEHPSDWLTYTKNMKDDYYDVVLDGPHFISWRVAMLEHTRCTFQWFTGIYALCQEGRCSEYN